MGKACHLVMLEDSRSARKEKANNDIKDLAGREPNWAYTHKSKKT